MCIDTRLNNSDTTHPVSQYSTETFHLLEHLWADCSSLWLALSNETSHSFFYNFTCSNGHAISMTLRDALNSLEVHKALPCVDCEPLPFLSAA